MPPRPVHAVQAHPGQRVEPWYVSGVRVRLAVSVELHGHQGDSDGDHADPETGCAAAEYKHDCAGEHEDYGDPDQWLPHGEYLPRWFGWFSTHAAAHRRLGTRGLGPRALLPASPDCVPALVH